MKTLDLNIDLTGINIRDQNPIDLVIAFMDVAVTSSFAKGNAGGISGKQQREINEVMGCLDRHREGIAELKDEQWAALIGWWISRNMPPVTGADRRLSDRIDRKLCPDAFKETGDAPK